VILVSFSYHSWAFPIYVIRDFTTAESYGAISDVVCVCMCILNWPLPIGAFQDQ